MLFAHQIKTLELSCRQCKGTPFFHRSNYFVHASLTWRLHFSFNHAIYSQIKPHNTKSYKSTLYFQGCCLRTTNQGAAVEFTSRIRGQVIFNSFLLARAKRKWLVSLAILSPASDQNRAGWYITKGSHINQAGKSSSQVEKRRQKGTQGDVDSSAPSSLIWFRTSTDWWIITNHMPHAADV